MVVENIFVGGYDHPVDGGQVQYHNNNRTVVVVVVVVVYLQQQ